jgi:hypothetical protein
MAIGALGIELAFFGQERQYEMLKLAEATNLSGILVDNERQQLNIKMKTQEALSNLELSNTHIAEKKAIDETNFNMADIELQGKSQMNQAESNRMLEPMKQVPIPGALKVPTPYLPRPLQAPRPLSGQQGLYPMIQKPLVAPYPTKGAMPARQDSGAGVLIGGVGNALAGLAMAPGLFGNR